jgi:hypothetical protein
MNIERLKNWWRFHRAISAAARSAPNRAKVLIEREDATVQTNLDAMVQSLRSQKDAIDKALEKSDKVMKDANEILKVVDQKK